MSNARELAELGGSYGTGGFVGMKNRIINGAMVIDQRNAGASVTVNSSSAPYCPDRWNGRLQQASGAFTMQQSTTVPAGFINSLLFTVTNTTAPAAGNRVHFRQIIEGYNVADLGWGGASAASVTLSFWVRSSVTGLYGVGFINSAENRSYVGTYTISSANTWEYKTIVVPGDTAGTWVTDNGNGIRLTFDLGSGTSFNASSANTWVAQEACRTSSCVSWQQNSGATFYITGVQLEKGSTATSFDYRPYGTEFALCQRYFQSFKRAGEDNNCGWIATSYNANSIYMPVQFFTIMRRVPDVLSGGSWRTRQSNLNIFTASFAYQQSGTVGCILSQSGSTNSASSVFWVEPDGSFSSAYLAFNGEL